MNSELFNNPEEPYEVLARYFDFQKYQPKPIKCVQLILDDCKERNLNNQQLKFLLDKFTGILFHEETGKYSQIYVEITDKRNTLFPYELDDDWEDNVWSIEKLRVEYQKLNNIPEQIRHLKLKQIQYNNAAEDVGFDIGISKEIDIEIEYLKSLEEDIRNSNLEINHENLISKYEEILNFILTMGKNLEKYTNLTKDMDEEDCRNYFLPALNTISKSYISSGEVFNKKGKTDILVQDTEGNNLFIGECKIWKGEEYLKEGIIQLLERYVNWRDERTAIIIFNKHNSNFSAIIEKAVNTMKQSKYFKEYTGIRENTSHSFLMKHPSDSGKEIKLELMIFNFKN